MLFELIRKNRSFRRFVPGEEPSAKILHDLVGLARLCPSGANLQPLKFVLSADPERNASVFPHLRWAGYLAGWSGPAEGERPTAYIVVLGDTEVSKTFGSDHGIAAHTMLLGASERGFGGCIIGSVDREGLRSALSIPERYEILLVLALGVPAEAVVLEELGEDGSIRYWRDAKGVHHVPKRALHELILET